MRQSSRSSSKPKKPERLSLAFEAIGTWWQIDATLAASDVAVVERAVRRRIAAFDHTYSRFRADSWIATLATKAGSATLPDDARPLLDVYQAMYALTDGAVTPLIGQVLSDAGYDATYSLRPKQMQPAPVWREVLEYDSREGQLTLLQPALLDFGAAGKGYLVDIVCELLETHGATAYFVDAGGDMRQLLSAGHEPVRIGMEHPDTPEQVVGIVQLGSQGLCGSAGNRRRWAGLHHIMHPQTLQPVRDIKAAWTVAPTALVADAMATCLFFAPGTLLQQQFDFEYTIIYADNSYFVSSHFPGELFAEG